MNLSELPPLVFISLLAILTIAATGWIAALHSWTRITAEQKGIKNAEYKLSSDDAWEDAYPHDKLKLATWLRQNGIKPDSHLGDFIRTCWSAWLGGRPASLTELHVLVARRERSHKATRLSAGIAALLLVCGIVGTLSAIKPVLGNFRFDTVGGAPTTEDIQSSDAETNHGDGDVSTDRVNKLIHDLGDAFLPSLLALLGTILVVFFRGIYSLSLHKFTLDLDRFAVDTLIPRYRVPSLSEQYQEVKATLSSVTESLLHREVRFHEAVQQLENLVAGISPALGGLNTAATNTKEAAAALASGATSITEALNLHLGAESSIHRAINGLDLVFKKTEQTMTNFASIVSGFGESNTASQQGLELAIQALAQSVGQIAADHRTHQSEADTAIREFKGNLAGIPAQIEATNKHAVDAGMTSLKSGIAQINEEQKKWHSASAAELKEANSGGLAEITKIGKTLVTQSERISLAASGLENIRTDTETALKVLVGTGQAQITQIGSETKSSISNATETLAEETNRIATIADRLSVVRFETTSNLDPQRDDTITSSKSVYPTIGKGTDPQPIYDDVRRPVWDDSSNPETASVSQPVDFSSPQQNEEVTSHSTDEKAAEQTLTSPEQQRNDKINLVGGDAQKPIESPYDSSKRKWWKSFTSRKL